MAKVIREEEPRETVVVERDTDANANRSNTGVIIAVIVLVIILLLLFFGGHLFGGSGSGGSSNTDVNLPSSGSSTGQ